LTASSCQTYAPQSYRTYVRSMGKRSRPDGPDGQALRRGCGGGAGRRDAGGFSLAGPALRGPRRDRTVAHRGPLVGGRPGPGVLAGGGQGGRGDRPLRGPPGGGVASGAAVDRKSTRLNSSHVSISYAVFCLEKT